MSSFLLIPTAQRQDFPEDLGRHFLRPLLDLSLFQVMEVSEAMGRIIMEGGNAMQIADQAAKEGVIDLRQAGLKKVKDGVTSLEEVNRVTIE